MVLFFGSYKIITFVFCYCVMTFGGGEIDVKVAKNKEKETNFV